MPVAGQNSQKQQLKEAFKRAETFFTTRLTQRRPWGLVDEADTLRAMVTVLVQEGWTRAGIARGSGVDLSQLAGWLAGRRRLGPRAARRLGRWARPALRTSCQEAGKSVEHAVP